MISITIDGTEYKVKKGITILAASFETQKLAQEPFQVKIPTLYYLKNVMDIDESGVCVVEVDGKLVNASTTRVREGMAISTKTEQVMNARKEALKKILAQHHKDCIHCLRNTSCELQNLLHEYELTDAVLAKKGFLDINEVIQQFSQFGSAYIGHPNNQLPGIEMNSGSLGHGLPVCVGMALAAKMDDRASRVYTVMGDGELAEGSIWEAAMASHQYKLDNLCAVVDRNHLQISGNTEDVMGHEDLHERFRSFGWHVIDVVNGNSVSELHVAFEEAKSTKGQPTVLIANTVKGKGSSVMEDKVSWHHHVPSKEEYEQIMKDFEERKEML